MKIAQRILAQARAEVEALAEANARLHNPPTLFNSVATPRTAEALGVNISDSSTYGDLARIRLLKPPTAHGGEPFSSYFDDEERAEEHIESQMDAADPDPRWQANREVRFAVKAYSTYADDVSTEMTGLPAEPVTESTLEEWDPHVISWSKCFKRFHATMWAYLTATKITTRTVKVFKILVDRANCNVIVQRRHRFALPVGIHSLATNGAVIDLAPPAWIEEHKGTPALAGDPENPYTIEYPSAPSVSIRGTETVWREGVGTLPAALDRARHFVWATELRGDNATLISFPSKPRKLIILDGNKVIYRPDRKGEPEHGRRSYTTRKEAGEAAQNIYAWAQAQGFAVRVWNKTPKGVTA